MQASDDFGVYKESRHCDKPNQPTYSRVVVVNNHRKIGHKNALREEIGRMEESDVIDIKGHATKRERASCRHCRF